MLKLGPLARFCFGMAGLDVIRKSAHRGISLDTDLRRLITGPFTFIDVGANVGLFSEQLSKSFPGSETIAIEPVPDTFAKLRTNVAMLSGVRAVQTALGEQVGTVRMQVFDYSEFNRVASETENTPTISVPITTLDRLCKQESVSRISLLKTDCEGYDLQVVRGASGLLADGKIDAVYCEVNFKSDGKFGDFFKIHDFLAGYGFSYYANYDYSRPDIPEFTNALWVLEALISRYHARSSPR